MSIRRSAAARSILAAGLLILSHAPAFGAAEEILARLRETNANLADLRASFVHGREVPLFDERILSSGELFYLAPDRLLLQYADPDSNRVVIGEGHVWLYYPSLRQAHRYDIDPESTLPGLFLAIRGTLAGLDRNFVVTGTAGADSSGAPTDVLVLRPKEGTALADEIREIRVAVRREDALPVRTDFFEVSGDHSWFTFSRHVRNPRIEPTVFHFEPPEGTEVFEVEGKTW
ncbi:MAG: outer membrane lipoprotein carrier protein LolA [Candidatus Eisenbacteria bacterium]|nr:outer membrane lipoprotein carrier protein LolA [Candidatus Eisenbacteria bacterium]